MTKLFIALVSALMLLTGCGSVQVRFTGQPTYTRHFQVVHRLCRMGESRHDSVTGPRGTSARAYDTVQCRWVDDHGRLCLGSFKYTTDMKVERRREGEYVAVPEEYIKKHVQCSYDNRSRRRYW